LLFKKRAPKKFTGYSDFVNKLIEMGLTRFIHYPINQKRATEFDRRLSESMAHSLNEQWWYLD